MTKSIIAFGHFKFDLNQDFLYIYIEKKGVN